MADKRSNSTVEQLYLNAVERGDIRGVEKFLEDKSEFDINAINTDGMTALQLAIKSGSVEILKVLLNHGVDIGDSLFHAIEAKFDKAIELILAHPKGKGLINEHAGFENEEFHPDTTPIILAAHHNDYDVIKLLIKRGAPPIALSSYKTENHTIQRSVGTLNVYKALASESYMSAIELKDEDTDPFRRAFKLFQELRKESSKEYEFREQYLELAEKCEQYAADLLGQTRDSSELQTILSHNADMEVKDIGKEERPTKVLYAVNKDLKKFVVHPHCQQQLITLWYCGLKDWRDKGWIRNTIISLLIMLAFPFLCLGNIILPFGKFGRFMRIPYIKFLMHTASYIWFLALLFFTTYHFDGSGEDLSQLNDEERKIAELDIARRYSQQRGPPPTPVDLLVVIWVIGMTCRELQEVWNSGILDYMTNAWNVMDILQLGLYWSMIALRLAAFILVHEERKAEGSMGKRAVSDDFGDSNDTLAIVEDLLNGTADDIVDRISLLIDDIQSSPQYEAALANISQRLSNIHDLVSGLADSGTTTLQAPTFDFGEDSRFEDVSFSKPRSEWSEMDPTLLADCIIALANVISVIRFLRVMVINEYVGPLQISVGKMMNDIMKFMFIFILVWVAFALGLTQVYWSYAADSVYDCVTQEDKTYPECLEARYFPDVVGSMRTLFWSLYGLIDLEALEVEDNHRSTEFFGGVLFAGYQIVAVIILLNLLIALMGTTYDNIVQNADIEWKFSRSDMWMDYFRAGTTDPPPFNVLPSTRAIISTARRLYYCLRCKKDDKAVAKLQRKRKCVNERKEKYKDVCRRLILRYVAEEKSTAVDAGDASAKSELSAFRFETYNAMLHLEKIFEQQTLEVANNLKTLSSALEDNNREQVKAMEKIKDQLNNIQKDSELKLGDLGKRLSDEHKKLLDKPTGSLSDIFEPGVREVTIKRASELPAPSPTPSPTPSSVPSSTRRPKPGVVGEQDEKDEGPKD
ncbi:short transient receptor potential channel 4-like isoform X1 [Ptychodera flava]|uniref:short transient receptor potential channel 4-like isoform X1 n=2 Tax=Ptychodera flava TaxID=63121 RepID=UPI003969F887